MQSTVFKVARKKKRRTRKCTFCFFTSENCYPEILFHHQKTRTRKNRDFKPVCFMYPFEMNNAFLWAHLQSRECSDPGAQQGDRAAHTQLQLHAIFRENRSVFIRTSNTVPQPFSSCRNLVALTDISTISFQQILLHSFSFFYTTYPLYISLPQSGFIKNNTCFLIMNHNKVMLLKALFSYLHTCGVLFLSFFGQELNTGRSEELSLWT